MDLLRDLIICFIHKGNFSLTSGEQSTLYFNVKGLLLTPEGSFMVAKRILNLLPSNTTAIGGMIVGACPIVSAIGVLAYQERRSLKLFYIRGNVNTHGLMNKIEGANLTQDDNVVIVEDVVTTGKSIYAAIMAVTYETGAKVAQAICVVDREQYNTAFIPLVSLYKASELVGE